MTRAADDVAADKALADELATSRWSLAGLRERRTGVKWSRYGDQVLPAWVADMDLPVAPAIRDMLLARVAREDLGYVPKGGGASALAFAEHMLARHGWQLDPARVHPMVDVVQGLYASVMAYSEPGDAVVIQTPIYPPMLGAIKDQGRRLLEAPLVAAGSRYEIDFDALEAACADARILILCNPHNPGGRAFVHDELSRMAEIALRHGLVVIADEIHSDLVFSGHEHLPFAGLGPEVEARTVTLNACTKAYNVAGLRYSLVHFGSEALESQFRTVPERLFGGPNAFGGEISALAWRECGAWQRAVVRYLEGNRDWLMDAIERRLPGVRAVSPEATYLAWLDCRELQMNHAPQAFFLEHARVGMNDGDDFGPPGNGHVRLNFATPRPVLEEIVARLEASLR